MRRSLLPIFVVVLVQLGIGASVKFRAVTRRNRRGGCGNGQKTDYGEEGVVDSELHGDGLGRSGELI